MLSALRGVLKECFRLGYTPAEDYHRARDLKSVRGSDLPKSRALSHGELRCLLEACAADAREGKKAAIGARDAALLTVLYGCSLRRSEAVTLNLPYYDRTTKELKVRDKGGKQRLIYAEGGAAEALDAWLKKRVRRDPKGSLFCPVVKAGQVQRRRLSAQAVLYILKKRAEEVGARDFSPHDMRRTFIGDLLDGGADLSAASSSLGTPTSPPPATTAAANAPRSAPPASSTSSTNRRWRATEGHDDLRRRSRELTGERALDRSHRPTAHLPALPRASGEEVFSET